MSIEFLRSINKRQKKKKYSHQPFPSPPHSTEKNRRIVFGYRGVPSPGRGSHWILQLAGAARVILGSACYYLFVVSSNQTGFTYARAYDTANQQTVLSAPSPKHYRQTKSNTTESILLFVAVSKVSFIFVNIIIFVNFLSTTKRNTSGLFNRRIFNTSGVVLQKILKRGHRVPREGPHERELCLVTLKKGDTPLCHSSVVWPVPLRGCLSTTVLSS